MKLKFFFDKLTFNIIGWRTKDIYQNISSTYLNSVKVNQIINEDLFKLLYKIN